MQFKFYDVLDMLRRDQIEPGEVWFFLYHLFPETDAPFDCSYRQFKGKEYYIYDLTLNWPRYIVKSETLSLCSYNAEYEREVLGECRQIEDCISKGFIPNNYHHDDHDASEYWSSQRFLIYEHANRWIRYLDSNPGESDELPHLSINGEVAILGDRTFSLSPTRAEALAILIKEARHQPADRSAVPNFALRIRELPPELGKYVLGAKGSKLRLDLTKLTVE